MNRWAAPLDAGQCAALLLAAETLLGDHDPATLREQVQPLLRSFLSSPHRRLHEDYHRRADFSPAFARALVRKTGGFHAARGERPRLRVPTRTCRFSVDEIPAYLPEHWYHAYFADLTGRVTDIRGKIPHHLRRAATLKLAEMTAGGAWIQHADELGIPRGAAKQTLDVLDHRFTESAIPWTTFETAVEQAAADLDRQHERVDYARRRRALATWHMPATDWADLCSGIPRLEQMATRTHPDVGSAIVWAQVTQAEHLHYPTLVGPRKSRQPTLHLTRELSALVGDRAETGGRAELRRRLDRYATALAGRCDNA
jgi:hypothetical protein